MPAHRRKQSNAMLYTLIIFVGLFLVSAVVAVLYYIKAEDYRITQENLQEALDEYVSENEKENIGSIVGDLTSFSTSYIQTMVDYLDESVTCVVGGVPESTSAQVKSNDAKTQTDKILKEVTSYIDIDPNMTGLVNVVSRLMQKLQDAIDNNSKLAQNIEDLTAKSRQRDEINRENYQTLLVQKEKLKQDYNDVKLAYAKLSEENKKTTGERVEYYKDQLAMKEASLKETNDKLLETQAVLSETQTMLADAKEELSRFGAPAEDSMAFMPDGQILSIDNNTQTVIINLGSNDHVYRGLTFSVYNKGAYIGQKGESKAEVEIFDIGDSYATARITKSDIDRPILKGDTVANLIWDNRKVNEFVIAGDFDINDDGNIDTDAISKIKATITKWGGKVTDNITVDTDFLILGTMPSIPEKMPTIEDERMNPTVMQDYEKAIERVNQYKALEDRAGTLWVPIFTYEKFINLIGYKGKIGQAGTF